MSTAAKKKQSPALIVLLVIVLSAGGYLTQVRGPRSETAQLKADLQEATNAAQASGPETALDKRSARTARTALKRATQRSLRADIDEAASRTSVRVRSVRPVKTGAAGAGTTAEVSVEGSTADIGAFVAALAGGVRMENGQLRGAGRLYLINSDFNLHAQAGKSVGKFSVTAPVS